VATCKPFGLYACIALYLTASVAFASQNTDVFGEKAARERIFSYLSTAVKADGKAGSVTVSQRPLTTTTGGFGTSVLADFPSSTKKEDAEGIVSLVIAVPLSTPSPSENSQEGFGIRVALALADRILRKGTPLPIRIAFLADERSELPADLRGKTKLGLRDLVDSLVDSERTVVIYIKLAKDPSRPVLDHGTAGSIAPRYLVGSLQKAFADNGASLPLHIPYNELYRLGLVQGSEELKILRELEIPAVVLTDSRLISTKSFNDDGLSAERTADALYASIIRLASVSAERDERYSIISFASLSMMLSEGYAVIAFIAIASLFLLAFLVYSLTHRHLLVARWKVFLRRSWVVFAFLAVLFLCVHVSGLILSFILSIAKANTSVAPYGAATLKILLAIAFYYALSPLFSFRAIPRRAHFFGSAAVSCLAIGALMAATMDFTFVPTFMWAFTLAFLSVSIPSPTIAALPAILAPLQIVGAAAAAVGSGDTGAAMAVLNGDPIIELYLAFIALPILFLFRRLSIMSRARTLQRAGTNVTGHRYRIYTRPIFIVGVLSAMTVLALNTTQTQKEQQIPVREETSDAKKFNITVSESTFLDRRTVRLQIKAEKQPIRIDLSFLTDERLTIYEAPCPFILSDNGRSASFVLGERPPDPLTLEITLPATLRGQFEARAIFYDQAIDRSISFRATVPVGPNVKP